MRVWESVSYTHLNDGKNAADPFFDAPPQDIPPQENLEKPQGGDKEQNVQPSSNGEAAKRRDILKKVIAVVLAVAALVIAFFYGMHLSLIHIYCAMISHQSSS